jgi:large subunit ribosomal protein L17
MRHRKGNKKLGKPTDQRIALLRTLMVAFFSNQKIKTTDTRAKEVRKVAEKIITYAKEGSLSSRRQALKLLPNAEIIKSVFNDLAPRFVERNGGYTRLTKLGLRQGDAATISLLELVD